MKTCSVLCCRFLRRYSAMHCIHRSSSPPAKERKEAPLAYLAAEAAKLVYRFTISNNKVIVLSTPTGNHHRIRLLSYRKLEKQVAQPTQRWWSAGYYTVNRRLIRIQSTIGLPNEKLYHLLLHLKIRKNKPSK